MDDYSKDPNIYEMIASVLIGSFSFFIILKILNYFNII